MQSITPAATPEPITPATLGPIACISRKLVGLAFWPSTCDTRAAIGTADTPADPMSGFIGVFDRTFISLAISTPPAVPKQNASTPRITILIVAQVRNVVPVAEAPTHVPSRITRIFESALDDVSDRRAVLPLSLNRLPIISIPISGATEGSSRAITTVTAIGKRIFSL